MPDIFYLFGKWWKQMFLVIIIAVSIVAAILFTQPSRYLSVTTALPASTLLTDKAKIFNDNIEGLYSSLGDPDDLDRILGTAQLDTVYIAVAMEFNLWDHYKIEKKDRQIYGSAALLKANSKVIRSEFGELKVKVWDTDKNLAPKLANAILWKLNSMHQSVQAASNNKVLNILINEVNSLKHRYFDGTHAELRSQLGMIDTTGKGKFYLGRLQQYEQLIMEYELALEMNPNVLVILEEARPSQTPDKPQKLKLLTATLVLSFFFSFLLALFLERRKRRVL
jgi:hypothetical protein